MERQGQYETLKLDVRRLMAISSVLFYIAKDRLEG